MNPLIWMPILVKVALVIVAALLGTLVRIGCDWMRWPYWLGFFLAFVVFGVALVFIR